MKTRILLGASIALALAAAGWLVLRTHVQVPSNEAAATAPVDETRLPVPGDAAGSLPRDARSLEALIADPPRPVRVTKVPDSHLRVAGEPGLRNRLEMLRAQARGGDIEAARELALDLLACQTYQRQLQAHARATDPGNRNRQNAVEPAARFLETSAAREAMCRGLTQAQIDEWSKWLRTAALGGDVASSVLFFETGSTQERLAQLATRPEELARFRNEATDVLERSARQCYPAALRALGNNHQFGVTVPVDPARGFGYWLAYQWAAGLQPAASVIDARVTALTPSQLDSALAFARQVFANYCG